MLQTKSRKSVEKSCNVVGKSRNIIEKNEGL